jgi:hypothetical protein
VYIRVNIALVRNVPNTDHGTLDVTTKAVYVNGSPGTWTVSTPPMTKVKDLNSALSASDVTISAVGDVLSVMVTNSAVNAVDWSGYVQMTVERQQA